MQKNVLETDYILILSVSLTPIETSVYLLGTLGYLINMQEVINMQAGKISKIDKRAGGNKAVQVGIFRK